MATNDLTKKIDFDRDFSPEHPVNQQAAKGRGVMYDRDDKQYKDVDGCTTHDQFGQPH